MDGRTAASKGEFEFDVKSATCVFSGHFDAYFRMSLGESTLPKREVEQLLKIERSSIQHQLRDAQKVMTPLGTPKITLLFEELARRSENLSDEEWEVLLTAVFEISDELTANLVDTHIMNNIIVLVECLSRCFEPRVRSGIVIKACQSASLKWLALFGNLVDEAYHPRDDSPPVKEESYFLQREDADRGPACGARARCNGERAGLSGRA
jgi:hypothetical protein